MPPALKGSGDSLQTLMEAGAMPRTPQQVLRDEVLRRLNKARKEKVEHAAALQRLFPSTILDTEVLESIVTALIAGNHVLLFGPSGSGKTNLAKDVLNLIPSEVVAVEGCPVHDDPFSVADPEFYRRVPCCPFCKARFGGEVEAFDPRAVDPRDIPVRTTRIREGHGYARVQGSAEVFPDNLTGTINIRKLEEVGDPMSPMVLEPGKVLQANRGTLIVDEVGKLPLGTQNVLLQALQESIVSPAKSRETFPASFISISTSNINDLDNITEPLNDRLSSIYVGFSRSHASNRTITEMGSRDAMEDIFYPDVLFDAGVRMLEAWRRSTGELYELSEVGSNRTLIDIVTRAVAHARMKGHRTVSTKSYRRGLTEAMLGHVRARGGDSYVRDKDAIMDFIKERFKKELANSAEDYWCRFFEEELGGDKDAAARVIADGHEILAKRPGGKDWMTFSDFALQMERFRGRVSDEVVARRAFKLLKKAGVFGDLK